MHACAAKLADPEGEGGEQRGGHGERRQGAEREDGADRGVARCHLVAAGYQKLCAEADDAAGDARGGGAVDEAERELDDDEQERDGHGGRDAAGCRGSVVVPRADGEENLEAAHGDRRVHCHGGVDAGRAHVDDGKRREGSFEQVQHLVLPHFGVVCKQVGVPRIVWQQDADVDQMLPRGSGDGGHDGKGHAQHQGVHEGHAAGAGHLQTAVPEGGLVEDDCGGSHAGVWTGVWTGEVGGGGRAVVCGGLRLVQPRVDGGGARGEPEPQRLEQAVGQHHAAQQLARRVRAVRKVAALSRHDQERAQTPHAVSQRPTEHQCAEKQHGKKHVLVVELHAHFAFGHK